MLKKKFSRYIDDRLIHETRRISDVKILVIFANQQRGDRRDSKEYSMQYYLDHLTKIEFRRISASVPSAN